MLFSRCQRSLMRAAAATLVLCVAASSVAVARPKPGKGFRLLSSALTIFVTNRVQCRIFSDGSICATGSSTVGGGIWPRGTADQYIFGSGINIAGVIAPGDKSVNGFAGDTAGGFFNNTAGTSNGTEVRPLFSSSDPVDAGAWPTEARVPCSVSNTDPTSPCATLGLGTDPGGDLFAQPLQGAISASQGDLWFMSWEGDPAQLASRAHPLGVAVESRVLAWNFPSGNEDIMYLMYTFYNITSTNPTDYAAIRRSLRTVLLQKAADFQASNTAKYGINLPAGGYAINNLFAASVSDMDVDQADGNYASVNVPFALGYTYEHNFSNGAALGWTFDPSIFGVAPFFPGVGFVGTKFLRSPIDPVTHLEVGLTLFGTFTRSSSIQDPNDDKQLYRYITGGFLPADGSCSLPNPLQAHICFVNISSPADMRQFQSSGPLNLPPGGSGSIVVAYIFAAPVVSAGCPGVACDVKPATSNANLTIMGDAIRMAQGVNKIDTMTGYLSFNDVDGNGIVTQSEIAAVPGSLLGKSNTAQQVFNNKFLLPFAPDRPDFFLVPGNNQVTVLWNRSNTETTPDPFFVIASQPLVPDPITGLPVVNALYDPNFRGLDVEGYRIYRGRVDNPSELQLIAQFDYAPDATGRGIFNDFKGVLNPVPGCAPELGIQTTCPIVFSTPLPGSPFVGSVPVDLVGQITQVGPGGRVKLADLTAQILPAKLDTAFADISRGRVAQGVTTNLVNGGVPFLYVDHNVRNSLRYFYTVCAFDVNSLASGPSSLESQRKTKAVTPVPLASNAVADATISLTMSGRGGTLTNTTVPTIDATTGKFSGPFPPGNGGDLGLVSLVSQIVGGPTQLAMRLDSLTLGQTGNTGIFGGSLTPQPHIYWMTSAPGTPTAAQFSVPVQINSGGAGAGASAGDTSGVGFSNDVAPVDGSVPGKFEGGNASFKLSAKASLTMPANSYLVGQGLGCNLTDPNFDGTGKCQFNGARWFDGPSPTTNETQADPNGGNAPADESGATSFNNAGALTGVTVINEPHAYTVFDRTWRNMEWRMGGAARAADFNVYWGAAGLIDSVIDVTHDVVVPFSTRVSGSWGILNTAGTGGPAEFDTRNTVLTQSDLSCVEPLKTELPGSALRIPCDTLQTGPAYLLSQTAQLGSISFAGGATGNMATSPVAAQPGFLLYLAGHQFLMQMPALPASGTVWALRTYSGVINGGNGVSGNIGPYSFVPAVRPFTAVGATLTATITPNNSVVAATKADLSSVHTVPDPYYVESKFEASTDQKILKFVGLPQDAIIRIYSVSGVLVRMLEHHGGQYSSTSASQGSEMNWDLRNRNNQVVASGVYFYHIEAGDARRVGRFTVVNFAQ